MNALTRERKQERRMGGESKQAWVGLGLITKKARDGWVSLADIWGEMKPNTMS